MDRSHRWRWNEAMEAGGVTGLTLLGAIAVAVVVALAAALVVALLSGRWGRVPGDFLAGLAGAVLLGLLLPMLGVPISRTALEGLVMTTTGAVCAIGLGRLTEGVFKRNRR